MAGNSNKTLCYSVRVKELVDITPRCYKIVCFDGSSDLIPKSQIRGKDFSVEKSEAYWIPAWLLEKKNLQYSSRKKAYISSDGTYRSETYKVVRHIPEKIEPVADNVVEELLR